MTKSVNRTGRSSDPAETRSIAEERVASTRSVPAREQGLSLQELVHELQVHQVELEMQNDELTRTQLELEDSRDLYVELYDSAPVGYFTFSRVGRIEQVNLTGAELLGVVRNELIHRGFGQFVDPADLDPWERHLAAARVGSPGTKLACELTLRRGDGTTLVVHLESVSVASSKLDQRSFAFRTVLTDISAAKEAEAEVKRMTDVMRQAERMESVGRLAAGVAHDLNNYLSPVLGFSQMLAEDLDPTTAQFDDTQEIIRAAECCRDLVKQLLAFARGQVLDVKVVDLRSVVHGMERLLRRTLRENISIEIVSPAEDCGVEADAGQIAQVLLNLAVNAQESMREGGRLCVELSVEQFDERTARRHPGMEAGQYVVLRVSDSGCGMDEETQKHVFEPFFTTKQTVGTGLGLASVFGIVRQHRGCVWVTSKPGQGSVFTACLPNVPLDTATQPVSPRTIRLAQGSETILVVEDNELTLKLIREILQRQGYTVLCAVSGEDALALLSQQGSTVNLLLTDVMLPGINGRVTAARAREQLPALPVLYTSGYSASLLASEGKLEPGIVLVQKPFTVAALSAAVRDALDKSSQASNK